MAWLGYCCRIHSSHFGRFDVADAIKSVEATAIQEAVLDATMKLANDGLVSEPVAAVAD